MLKHSFKIIKTKHVFSVQVNNTVTVFFSSSTSYFSFCFEPCSRKNYWKHLTEFHINLFLFALFHGYHFRVERPRMNEILRSVSWCVLCLGMLVVNDSLQSIFQIRGSFIVIIICIIIEISIIGSCSHTLMYACVVYVYLCCLRTIILSIETLSIIIRITEVLLSIASHSHIHIKEHHSVFTTNVI